MQRFKELGTKKPAMARLLRGDELGKYNAVEGSYLVMMDGAVEVVPPAAMKKRFERPDARSIHND